MALLNFDATTVAPSTSKDPVPAGKYLAVICASEMKPTRTGAGQYLECEYQIIDGPFKGRKLWSRHNLKNLNPQAVQVAQRDLSSICHAVGVMQTKDSGELHHLPLTITVKAKNPNSAEPAAKPSKPSVTLTALVVLHTMNAVQTIKIGPEISQPGLVARVNEIVSTTPVVLDSSHSNNSVIPKVIQPFFFQKIPRLCWRRTFK